MQVFLQGYEFCLVTGAMLSCRDRDCFSCLLDETAGSTVACVACATADPSVKMVNRVSRLSRDSTSFSFCSFISACLVVGTIRVTTSGCIQGAEFWGKGQGLLSVKISFYTCSLRLASLFSVLFLGRQFYVLD